MRQTGCPETSVSIYQSKLCNIPKERVGSLKSRPSSCYTSNVLLYVPYEYTTWCSVVPYTYCKIA